MKFSKNSFNFKNSNEVNYIFYSFLEIIMELFEFLIILKTDTTTIYIFFQKQIRHEKSFRRSREIFK